MAMLARAACITFASLRNLSAGPIRLLMPRIPTPRLAMLHLTNVTMVLQDCKTS